MEDAFSKLIDIQRGIGVRIKKKEKRKKKGRKKKVPDHHGDVRITMTERAEITKLVSGLTRVKTKRQKFKSGDAYHTAKTFTKPRDSLYYLFFIPPLLSTKYKKHNAQHNQTCPPQHCTCQFQEIVPQPHSQSRKQYLLLLINC